MLSITSVLMVNLYFSRYITSVTCFHFESQFYFKDKSKMKQITQTLQTIQAPRSWNCGVYCNRRSDCRGFNYNSDIQECQLLMWPDNETMISEGHSVWFKRITCTDNPCENGGSCRDRPGYIHQYKCDCLQGWCGRRCEELHYNGTDNTCFWLYDLMILSVSTPDECMRRCLDRPLCKSTAFNNDLNSCYLKTKDHTEIDLTPGCYGLIYAYYYPLKECYN
ncbi:uncharacterized protein LOC143224259 [Tachypleus tridentatus]|uniref:uncharacterized protein LOC143224259 n=1 Tax=Tachypleus tridentatus TaxID=6853 RepID=UPI003FD5419F